MKFKMQNIAIAAGFALAAITAPALAGSIKIGFNVPLTGFAAADGNSALVGAQLAVEQVNGADLGGRSLTVNEAKPRPSRSAGGGGGGGGRRDRW